jgi:iron complex transport system substrate-binding protein
MAALTSQLGRLHNYLTAIVMLCLFGSFWFGGHIMIIKFMAAAAFAVIATTGVLAQDFPVTVEHYYGETTVEAAPQRIVSVGMHEQDFLYALGLSPVGVKEWWGEHPYATWPWAEDERAALGAEPEVMNTEGINFEWVAAQDPDLIIAIYVSMDEESYARLSQIAPTVVTPAGYEHWGAPWQAELAIIDRATSGTTEKSDAIVADFAERYAAVREQYPELAGKTGTNLYYADGAFTAWGSGDLASKFLIDLGLVFPPELDALAQDDNRIDISAENIDLLDMDVAIWPIDSGDTTTQSGVEAMDLYQRLDIAREGRSIWLDDGDGLAYAAMSWQTPLSLGYLLDVLPPKLAAAADGDPATAVE